MNNILNLNTPTSVLIFTASVIAFLEFMGLILPLTIQTFFPESSNLVHPASPVDSVLVKQAVNSLHDITNNKGYSQCDKCKKRLSLGKDLSTTRPDLIPKIYVQWCKESKYRPDDQCEIAYNRSTIHRTTFGSNFIDLVSLMDPISLDGDYFCHYIEQGQCPYVQAPDIDVSHLWGGQPKDEKFKVAPEPGNETFNVLHVSDFHIHLDYTVGGEANCSWSMCCSPHSYNEEPTPENYDFSDSWDEDKLGHGFSFYDSHYVNGTFQKGEWIGANSSSWSPAFTFGNYLCDAPEVLINSSLDSIIHFKNEQGLSFDFAIFTGDLVDHDEMKYVNYQSTVQSEEFIFRDIKFKLQDIPLYPVLGNHDTFPYAQLGQEKYGFNNLIDWNTELMADLWKDYNWIDSGVAQKAKEHYTGFSVKSSRGLKIISLNSNTWYVSNFYAYINMTLDYDSFGQFQFLVDELLLAEAKGERVWLIMHVPAGVDMLPIPSKILAQIIERFSPYTIAGIFNGHTHRDEFKVLYANSEASIDNAIANTWIAPSVTSWPKLNPSFRFLQVDTRTFSVMNAFTYYAKLNETFTSNGSEPVWELEYDARKDYNIKDWPSSSPLNATYWHRVAENIKSSSDSLQTYENFATRFSPYTSDCKENEACKHNWCYVTSFTVDQYVDCCKAENIEL